MENLHITRIKVLTAGVSSLILMLGIARFAYTPLLPIMQEQAGLGLSEGGWLASINYIGYFSGVILASLISNMQLKDRLYRIGILIAIISTFFMAVATDMWLWGVMRYLAGLSSAAGLILGSGLILNWLIRHGFRSELGIHFSGVGLGIALCAIVIHCLSETVEWQWHWISLSIIGCLLALPAWAWLPRPENTETTTTGDTLVDRPPGKTYLQLFIAAYLCAGIGYVVSATFIVAIVEQQSGGTVEGNLVFLALGLAAAPACFVWDLIARKTGDLTALILAFIIHTLGIAIPLFNTSVWAGYLSAVLYGGTFIGIVSLVLTMAGRFYPSKPARMMGKMTLGYCVAQVIAPAITGYLAETGGSYEEGLALASMAMIVGTLFIAAMKWVEKPVMHTPSFRQTH